MADEVDIGKLSKEALFNRLGSYFEHLVSLGLSGAAHKILAKNVQLTELKQTVGEVDFLYESGSKTVHLEMAYKVYALHNGEWIGPNARDRFHKKLEKLFLHQTQLSNKYNELWRQNKLPIPQKIEIGVQGRLFIPCSDFESFEDIEGNGSIKLAGKSIQLNVEDCIDGYWLKKKDFLSYCESRKVKEVQFLKKEDWIYGSNNSLFLSIEKAQELLTTHQSVILKTFFETSKSEHKNSTYSYLLLLPDNWPKMNRKNTL